MGASLDFKNNEKCSCRSSVAFPSSLRQLELCVRLIDKVTWREDGVGSGYNDAIAHKSLLRAWTSSSL